MKKVAVIDYAASNISSVFQACRSVELRPFLAVHPEDLARADGIILPGVGSFKHGMAKLRESGMAEALIDKITAGEPVFGICLGMQLLCKMSPEFEITEGLGVIDAKVQPLRSKLPAFAPVPKIMWNSVQPGERLWVQSPLEPLNRDNSLYFIHSYYCSLAADSEKYALGWTSYFGFSYCSSILKENVFAVQFHPEKSRETGIEIYRAWKRIFLDAQRSR